MGVSNRWNRSVGLEGVRKRFERWRRAHEPCSRIPDALWAAAVRVAGTCGLHRTSKTLRLDYYSLKKRVEQQSTAAVGPLAGAAAPFLELAPSAFSGPGDCTLELEDASGSKMRVHLKAVATPDLAALCRSFWNPR
jgi:hypothetical protein